MNEFASRKLKETGDELCEERQEALAVCLHKVHSAKFQVLIIVFARLLIFYILDILLQL